jgi:hypothetical protein
LLYLAEPTRRAAAAAHHLNDIYRRTPVNVFQVENNAAKERTLLSNRARKLHVVQRIPLQQKV